MAGDRQRVCGACDGTGQGIIMIQKPCPHCAGGTRRVDRPAPPGMPCPQCNGRGRITTYQRQGFCRSCGGRGTVAY